MPINTEAKIKDRENNLIRVNSQGISNQGEINTQTYKLLIYSCNSATGTIRLNEELNIDEMILLRNYLNTMQNDELPQVSTEDQLVLIQNQFTTIQNVETVRNLISKLGTDKLNMIKDSLSSEELNNLGASIKQTLHQKEITNLKELIIIDKEHPKRDAFFREFESKPNLQKYLTDENGNRITQQERVLENWIKNNLWVLGIEFFEDLKKKNLRDFVQGGINVMPDFVFKNKNNFLSLIEIKRAKEKLFYFDRSHNTFYKATNLSKAESQCINYLRRAEELKRAEIEEEWGVEVLRPKIQLIYGSYSNDNELKRKEKEELKCLNFHLNGIEIITYDDLIEMGEKIISSYNVEVEA